MPSRLPHSAALQEKVPSPPTAPPASTHSLSVTLVGVALACAVLVASPLPALAQDGGAITGVVIDAETGETLVGANVLLADTMAAGRPIGATTDLDGRFEIDGLAPGRYDVKISYIGYQTKTVTGVQVLPGEATRLDVTLAPATAALEQVVITAEAARNSEAGLLRRRQKAEAISNAISAEAMREAGVSTAASAMKKVTGVAVTDGKYVNIRGLGGRYVNTQLNGGELASASPNKSAVPFDLFPASMLKNIVVKKTFTPDQPGSFTGGNIILHTRSYPAEFNVTASSSLTYNSVIGFGGNLLRVPGSASGIPASLHRAVPALTEALGSQAKAGRLNAATRAFTSAMAPVMGAAPLDQSYGLSMGNAFELFGGRPLGVLASFTYDRSVSGYEGGRTARYFLGAETLEPDILLEETAGTVETLIGGLATLSLKPHPKHELGVTALYDWSETFFASYQEGSLPRDLPNPEAVFKTRVLRHTIREMQSLQGWGVHVFGRRLFGSAGGVRLTWNVTYAHSTQEDPDYRFFANTAEPTAGGTNYAIQPSLYPVPTRYFRNLTETSWSNDLAITVPIEEASVKVGVSYLDVGRSFRERRFEYLTDKVGYQGDPAAYFTGPRAGLVGKDPFGYRFGSYINKIVAPRNFYDGAKEVSAAFAMIDTPVPLLPRLRFVGGIRVERTEQRVATLDENPAQGAIQRTDWLPSVHLTYALTDETKFSAAGGQMNLRFAYGRTLARPSFREFAPFCSFEFIGGLGRCGNPNLKRSLVNNYDLRWEWFTGPGELLAVSAFYKGFIQPIERTIDPVKSGDNPVITYENVGEGRVYGLELEVRKQLDFVAGWLSHFEAGGNLTLIRSEGAIAEDELTRIRSYNPDADGLRRLQGQSPYLMGASLTYDNPISGTAVSLFYNVFGPRLHTVADGPDVYEQPRHMLDLIASQHLPFGLEGFELSLKIENILDEKYVLAQTYRGESYVRNSYPLGRSVTVGLSYSL